MISYGPLARFYDGLTGDVPYEAFAAYYRSLFASDGGEFHLLLDLCCGTGTLTVLLAKDGYEMIGADSSPDMLSVAREKAEETGVNVLFLCQSAGELDLYGTVDAAISSLDSFNYLEPESLPEVLHRLYLFIRPGGLLIFDIRSKEWLKQLDGSTFVDEDDDVLCLWRADYDEEEELIVYGMDLFSRSGMLWERQREEHVEYAYEVEEIVHLLTEAGFESVRIDSKGPQGEIGRRFLICKRKE
ncbi:MAG: methyltransferase domain-containing protein [Oscillospiraceae bacterium]|nr:methyltransferase domain-containing protein [Oscillospiraceae bacterium]